MSTGKTGFKSPIVFGEGGGYRDKYKYRNGLGMMNSAEFYVFHDDFFGTITTNAPVEPNLYTAIIDTGATIVGSTTAGDATGVLFFDSDGAAEGASIYLPEFVQLTVGKKFFMECRFKTEVADDSDVQFGLSSVTATTNPEDLWTTTAVDVISFGVLDGGSGITGMLSDLANTGSAVQVGSISLVSATWHILAIAYDGNSLTGWVDGQQSLLWSGAATTIPTGVTLAPFVGFRNGSSAANEGQCDYLRFVMER